MMFAKKNLWVRLSGYNGVSRKKNDEVTSGGKMLLGKLALSVQILHMAELSYLEATART